MTERESMIQIYSDFHKEAYGFRPHGVNYHEFTLEQLKADFDMFESLCKQNEREEEARANWARQEFEKRVETVIGVGAGDRQTALRWILDSYDASDMMYGMEGFCSYYLGLGWTDYAKELAKELEPLAEPIMKAFNAERYADMD